MVRDKEQIYKRRYGVGKKGRRETHTHILLDRLTERERKKK